MGMSFSSIFLHVEFLNRIPGYFALEWKRGKLGHNSLLLPDQHHIFCQALISIRD